MLNRNPTLRFVKVDDGENVNIEILEGAVDAPPPKGDIVEVCFFMIRVCVFLYVLICDCCVVYFISHQHVFIVFSDTRLLCCLFHL